MRTAGLNYDYVNWQGYSTGKNKSGSNMNLLAEVKSPQTLGAGEKYDTLILTENHHILHMIRGEQTVELARQFHDVFQGAHSSVETFLYHSWLDIPTKANPANWIAHERESVKTWECVASKINLSLAADGRADRLKVLPAGGGLTFLLEKVLANEVRGISGTTEERVNLLFSDNVHLTPLGMYYVSALVYSSVFRKAAQDLSPPQYSGIAADTASDLQSIAWDYTQAYYTRVDQADPSMEECRAHMVNTYCDSYYAIDYYGQPGHEQDCKLRNTGTNHAEAYFLWPDPSFNKYDIPN